MRIQLMIVLALAAGLTLFLVSSPAAGDGDRRSRKGAASQLRASPTYTKYAAECGSCHLAFPPGLLPARSWRAVMAGLADHFGESAELDAATTATLTSWLTTNAAETHSHPRSAKILRSVRGTTPLRPSQTPYLLAKHDEIAPAVFRRKAVASRSNCGGCHRGAEQWEFDDDDVTIPAGP